MNRRLLVVAGGIPLVVVAAGALLVVGPLSHPGGAPVAAAPTGTATVERKTLNATTQVDGTLGYADSYGDSWQSPYSIANGLATTGGADATSVLQSYASAQAQYDSAVNALDALRHPKPTDLAQAQAQLAQVEATLTSAEQTAAGPTPKDVDQARAQLASAEAQLAQAQEAARGATPAQLAQAQAQLAQAQAQLVTAQNAAAGPSASQSAQAQAAVTQASAALASDQAALAQAAAALTACTTPTATPTATPTPAPTSLTCDPGALQLAVQQAQNRVTTDQAQLTAAQAQLAGLTSAESQAQAQANLTSAQAQVSSAQSALFALTAGPGATTQSQLSAAQAAAQAAQTALDAMVAGNPQQARAQLNAARAQLSSAQTALDGLRHPTASSIQLASDAVKAAKAGLDAARGKIDQPRGVLTQIARVGSVVQPGGVLYTLDGTHSVVLMDGSAPAWRDLGPGASDGSDVRQLETNLKALGFAAASMTVDDHWDAQTTAAVKRWQRSIGLSQDGLIPMGEVVFEPGSLRVTSVSASLGAMVQQGAAVLVATTTDRVVSVSLDPALQTNVKAGDKVSIGLPDGSSTPGTVSDIGTVATKAASNDPNSSASPTIAVTIALDDPAAAGTLDQAPVTVDITTATASDVLAVPVQALVQLLEGGYAVQVVDAGKTRYVGVQLGLFANGWVQVNGTGLTAGQTVVVSQ